MNRHASIAAEAFAAGSFAISVLLTALRTTDTLAALHTEQVLLEPRTAPLSGFSAPVVAVRDNLLSVVSQPTNPVLWALLIAVIGGLLLSTLLSLLFVPSLFSLVDGMQLRSGRFLRRVVGLNAERKAPAE